MHSRLFSAVFCLVASDFMIYLSKMLLQLIEIAKNKGFAKGNTLAQQRISG